MSARSGEVDAMPASPARSSSPPPTCPSCRRALPPEEPRLARCLVEALGDAPEGMTSTELAKSIRRRRTAVEAELERLRASGLVERVEGRRKPRGWNARCWRLAKGPGQDEDKRQSFMQATGDHPPALGELGLYAALSALLGTRSLRAALAFLGAAALLLLGLALELRALPAVGAGGKR